MGINGIQGLAAVVRPSSTLRSYAPRQAGDSGFAGLPVPDLRQTPVELKVDGNGDLVATASFLGVLPVKVAFDPEDVLAGHYGRQVTLDMSTPGKAAVMGDMHVEALEVPAFEVPDHGMGQAFKSLEFVVVADHQIHVTGILRVGPLEVPFQADAQPVKTDNGLYSIGVSKVWMFGSWPVPAWLATWLTSSVVSWATPFSGFGRPASDRFAIDLRSALNGEPSRIR